MPDDDLTVLTSLDFAFADEEFLPDGTRQNFPLNGRYVSGQFTTTLRYGFTEDFEGGLTLRPKVVSFQSDPIILPKDTDQPSRDLLDFSSQQFGMGDVDLFARYQLLDRSVVASTETRAQLPTGYEPPEGTFVNDDFETRTVADDSTLGDGRAHLQQSFFVGAYIPRTQTFARADVGYRLIFGGVGDQVVGGVKVGQNIMGAVIPFLGVRGAYTVYEGQPIGKTAIAKNPNIPHQDFDQSNIRNETLRLDRNHLQLTAGVIVPIERAELQFSYTRLLVGENIPLLNTLSMGLSTTISSVTGENG
jgi:hypothetical protein